MNINANEQSWVPPGFRFHPTEEELLSYYLRKKLASDMSGLDFIRDIELTKLEPWDIQEKCRIGTWPQNEWYLFSSNGKKYQYGIRTNRATASGFWKATGRDKVIQTSFGRIGLRKTLVFYKGRAPHSRKSDWIMHEYRLDENSNNNSHISMIPCSIKAATQDEGWVICKMFQKKMHHHRTSVKCNTNCSIMGSFNNKLNNLNMSYPTSGKSLLNTSTMHERFGQVPFQKNSTVSSVPTDWATLDKFVACQLNGTSSDPDRSMQIEFFDEPGFRIGSGVKYIGSNREEVANSNGSGNGGDGALWSFKK